MITRRNVMLGTGAAVVAATAAYAVGPSYDQAVAELWRPVSANGPRDLYYLVHHARLAANAHNTQPWRFALDGSRATIAPDLSRATPVVDPDHHHLFASLGCAAENLALAAAAAGSPAAIGFDGKAVMIDLATGAPRSGPMFEAIFERQSTRSEYDGRKVPAGDLERVARAASVEGCDLVLLTDPAAIAPVLDLAVEANTAQIADPAFVDELRHWLRFNGAQAINSGDGLYSGCTGNPSLPPWLGQIMFGLFFTEKSENEKLVRQIRSSAGLAVFVTGGNDPGHWVAAGRACQRFALQATALGMRHAFVNQVVEVPAVRERLAAHLGLGGRRPDLVMRFGYAPPMPRSLRRPVELAIA